MRGVAAIIGSCLEVCFSVSSSVFTSSRKRFGRHETDRGDGRCRWGVVVDSRARGRSADGNRNPYRLVFNGSAVSKAPFLREVTVSRLLLTLLVLVLIQEPAPGQPGPSEAAQAHERFNAGETIIEHVSNNHEHPLIELPRVGGIDFSITKHVFMLWFVAALVFLIVTSTIRRYLRQDRLVPSGFMNGLEAVVEFVRDDIAQPNVGHKWVMTWTPLILTFFFFILSANGIGLIPIFDTLAVLDRFVLHTSTDSFLNRLIHGGTTATANFNVTAALASITFISIIIAGTKAHGFVQHWN